MLESFDSPHSTRRLLHSARNDINYGFPRKPDFQPQVNVINGTLPVTAMACNCSLIRSTDAASGNIFLLTCISASVDKGCQNTPSRLTVISGTRLPIPSSKPSRE